MENILFLNNIKKYVVDIKYAKDDLSQVNPQLYEWLASINDKSSFDDSVPQPSKKINTPDEKSSDRFDTDYLSAAELATPPSVLAYHLFLPRFFAALRALHIASPAKMRGKIHALKGRDIFVSAFFAPVISRDLLDF